MDITVKLNKYRMSPKKIRPILHVIKGKSALKAAELTKFVNKGCAIDLHKLIKNGISIAQDREMNVDNLVIKNARCDQDQTLKRHRFGSRGRVYKIRKRSSNIIMVVSDNQTEKQIKSIDKKSNKKVTE